MGSSRPPAWTFAARAAYFGDRMCAFCDHRNPAGARFCNECAAPLDLKPCKRCDAVNEQGATQCYKCGEECAVLPAIAVTPGNEASSAAGASSASSSADAPIEARGEEAPSALPASRAGARSRGTVYLLLAAGAMIVGVVAYGRYRASDTTPSATSVASQPMAVPERAPPPAAPAVATVVTSPPLESTNGASVPTPVAAADPDPSTPATLAPRRPFSSARPAAHARASAVTSARHASARQRPPHRQASSAASHRAAPRLAGARSGTRVAHASHAVQPAPFELMQASLARCDGGLIARIACDQRVRRHFCAGRWGEAPECAGAAVNERGQ